MPPLLMRVSGLAVTVALVLGAVAAASAVPALWTGGAGQDGGLILRVAVAPGIAPGASRPVRVTASNRGSGAVVVRSLRLAAVTADPGHPGCVTRDFKMADVPQHATIAAGAQDHELAHGTLVYVETGIDQSACMGARLTLRLSSR
jgi:hypothetical protein